MKKLISILLVPVFVLLAGCAPRGETRTLDQVLEDARARFNAVSERAKLSAEVTPLVSKVSTALEAIAGDSSGPQVAGHAKQVEEALGALVIHAGYPSRPALTELQKQFAAIADPAVHMKGEEKRVPNPHAARRLLAARTYDAVSAELETTAFAVDAGARTEGAKVG